MAEAKPTRVGKFSGTRPLCAADLHHISAQLKRLGYPGDCPVEIVTPLPPKDRRVVDVLVYDYTPEKELPQ